MIKFYKSLVNSIIMAVTAFKLSFCLLEIDIVHDQSPIVCILARNICHNEIIIN